MHITRLNVLSPRKKANLRRLVYFQFVKNVFEILLIIVAVFGIILLSARVILIDYFSTLTAQSISVQQSSAQKNRSIRAVNQQITHLTIAQKEYVSWTPVMTDIAAHIPPNVELTKMTIKKSDSTLAIAGVAKTREDLLALKEKLESLAIIQQVNISLEQLTAQTNIPFSLTIPLTF